jgi:hypothetical protein
MKKNLAILNSISILAVIAINGIAGSSGIFGETVGGVSAKYNTLFTPAGYAFSIWGIIYLGLIAFAIYQNIQAFKNDTDSGFIIQIGPWMVLNSLANIAWIFAWLSEHIGLSLLLMLIILGTLIVMISRLNMERWDAPFPIIAFIWWPICIYSGWIAVATIANVSAFLVSIQWLALFSAINWTVIMIFVAVALNLLMIRFRNMREFAAVGVWALLAIALRHWDAIELIQWTALFGVLVLFVALSVHAYINRSTSPLIKFREFYKK